MSKALKITALTVVTVLALSGIAMAADQVRTRQKLKDGSCTVAASQLRTRQQLKDGSCTVAAAKARLRKQLKDGSCLA